jgi:uncharacterized membrane protein
MNETLILSLHALPGLLAVILGSIVLLSKKGTKTHKRRGYQQKCAQQFAISLDTSAARALG